MHTNTLKSILHKRVNVHLVDRSVVVNVTITSREKMAILRTPRTKQEVLVSQIRYCEEVQEWQRVFV